MSNGSKTSKILNPAFNPATLLAGSLFFSAGHGGVFTLALPFVVKLLGGSEKDVGLCVGLSTLAYLISCLTAAPHLDRFCPKRTLQLSSAVITSSIAAIYIYCKFFSAPGFINPILILIALNILAGLALAMFWPPMMGWLSTGHEGHSLSRRFGMFNLSWSLALVIAPLFAGFIVQTDPILALLAAAGCIFAAFVSVSIAKAPAGSPAIETPKAKEIIDQLIHPLNNVFSLMSRYSLVSGCFTWVIFRTQFALLFTEDFAFTESQFGIATAIFSFASLAGFYFTGKTKAWHHRLAPLVISQIMLAAAMTIILCCRSIELLYLAAILLGIGQSFGYASHQYYCVSGKKNRSGAMAVHEILISIGYGSGAFAGGYLAEYLSPFSPYWFCLITVLIALAAQLIIFQTKKSNPTS